MGCLGCRVFVAFLLKFLNFIQSFIGASMILYAVWMLNHWNSHVRPPPIAPAPNNVDGYNLQAELMSLHSSVGQQLDVPFSNPQTISRADQTQFRKLGQHSFGIVAGADLDAVSLPAPWFIYTFLGIGIIVCVITCIGHVAAEITNGFCLCCYSTFIVLLILVEAALVGDIFFNHNWEKVIFCQTVDVYGDVYYERSPPAMDSSSSFICGLWDYYLYTVEVEVPVSGRI